MTKWTKGALWRPPETSRLPTTSSANRRGSPAFCAVRLLCSQHPAQAAMSGFARLGETRSWARQPCVSYPLTTGYRPVSACKQCPSSACQHSALPHTCHRLHLAWEALPTALGSNCMNPLPLALMPAALPRTGCHFSAYIPSSADQDSAQDLKQALANEVCYTS